jgi:putative AlgH/UPF0301 family transcriptional regulator
MADNPSKEEQLEQEVRRLRALLRRSGDELDFEQARVRVYRRVIERLGSADTGTEGETP